MNQLHRLLRRQLRRYVGSDVPTKEDWQAFVAAVNDAYGEFDANRLMLDRAIALSSKELVQANAELRGILQALPDLLFRIDNDGRIRHLTQHSSTAFQLPWENLNSVLRDDSTTGIARQLREALQEVRKTGTSVIVEYQDTTKPTGRYYEARLLPFVQGDIIGVVRDITVRKAAEEALRTSEKKARIARTDLLQVTRDLEIERAKLEHLATCDSLTGIWNRRAIFDRLNQELASASRADRPVTVIMGDLDRFKEINDRYGHPAGDQVLQEIARRLAAGVRTEDDVGRYGGEEFLIVLRNCNGAAAVARAEKLRRAVDCTPITVAAATLHMTCSFGVSWTQGVASDVERLVQEADDALYRAKLAGRNRVVLADAQAGTRHRVTPYAG